MDHLDPLEDSDGYASPQTSSANSQFGDEAVMQDLFEGLVDQLKHLTSHRALSSAPEQQNYLSNILYKVESWGLDINADDRALATLESERVDGSQAVQYLLEEALTAVNKISEHLELAPSANLPTTDNSLLIPQVLLDNLQDPVNQLIDLVEPINIIVSLSKSTGPIYRMKLALDEKAALLQQQKDPERAPEEQRQNELVNRVPQLMNTYWIPIGGVDAEAFVQEIYKYLNPEAIVEIDESRGEPGCTITTQGPNLTTEQVNEIRLKAKGAKSTGPAKSQGELDRPIEGYVPQTMQTSEGVDNRTVVDEPGASEHGRQHSGSRRLPLPFLLCLRVCCGIGSWHSPYGED